MPNLEMLPRSAAGPVSEATLLSFQNGRFDVCRVHGPCRLARLLSHAGVAPEGQSYAANREDGAFWFLEEQLLQLRTHAMADLSGEGGGMSSQRLGFYLRIVLRDLLAVRRDWTPSFDYYSVLAVPKGRSVVALVGTVAGQPVYDPASAAGRGATGNGIQLQGGLTQFVLDFSHPANIGLTHFIQGPFGL